MRAVQADQIVDRLLATCESNGESGIFAAAWHWSGRIAVGPCTETFDPVGTWRDVLFEDVIGDDGYGNVVTHWSLFVMEAVDVDFVGMLIDICRSGSEMCDEFWYACDCDERDDEDREDEENGRDGEEFKRLHLFS